MPDEPVLENSFVSSKGWVKPGETYPFTVRVRNYTDAPFEDLTVTVSVPDGTTLLSEPTFTVDVPAGGVAAKVLEARADTLAQDPQIVWKDLSSTATLGDVTATSHGPKVIPPSGGYETARYGDRPFPVVPVDFSDRAHGAGSSAGRLATKINDPDDPGLHVQPLPGDVLRAAVPARHRAVGRRRHRGLGLRARLRLHAEQPRARHLPRRHERHAAR